MASLTFTQREIDELTERIGSLASGLSESQRRLLLAIFAAGLGEVQGSPENKSETLPAPEVSGGPQQVQDPPAKVQDPPAVDAAKLRDQLRQSFVPGGPPPPRPLVIRVTP